MDDVGFYAEILRQIEAAIRPGALALREQMVFWFGLFLWLQVIRTFYAFLFNGHLLEQMIATLIKGGLCWWFLYNYFALFEGMVRYFVELGLTIGGNRITPLVYLDPGEYLRLAGRVTEPVRVAMENSMGLRSLPLGLAYLLLWIGFTMAFGLMALNVYIWQIELVLAMAMGLVLIPTLTFRSTSWMGQGVLSFMVNKSFKLATGAAMTSLTFPLVQRFLLIPAGQQVSLWRCLMCVIGAWSFCILFLMVSRLAGAMLSGVPATTAGDVIRTAIGTVAGSTAVLSGGSSLALRGAAGVLQAGAGMTMLPTAMQAGTVRGLIATPMAARLGTYAGHLRQGAAPLATRSIRSFADTARLLSADYAGQGVRR
jgi:TrbL/VirB6 plasmid conjugal transfer protein